MSEENRNNTINVTQVLSDSGSRNSREQKVSWANNIIREDERFVDLIDLNVDSSLEFRHSLDKNGNRYRMIKLIAEGGFGRIFLAEDRILGRKVAVKSLRNELLDNPEVIRKFIAEAKLTAQLDHPAIIPLIGLDSDSADGLHLAMQLINGITLKEYLNRCRMQTLSHRGWERLLTSRLESFLRVCDAVAYSHSRHIIHCDLKPENIMLGHHGEVYVMDWGIAMPEGTDRQKNLSGTPAYIAPEALQKGATTPQTDVFSLGMILNEIVTLRGPVTGVDSKEVIGRICTGNFEPSTCFNSRFHIPAALRAIIEKARAVNPESRYQSVEEFANDIRHYLFKEEVSACPDSILQKCMRFLFRHRYVALWIIIISLFLSSSMVVYSLIEYNRHSTMVNWEMMRRLKLQRITDHHATEFNDLFLRLEEKLSGISSSLGMELVEPGTIDRDAEIYLLSEFAPQSGRKPPRSISLPLYRHEINMEYPAYLKPESMSRMELEEMVRPLWMFRRPILSLILGHVRNDDGSASTPVARLDRFKKEGGLLRRVDIFFSNGVIMRYPGMYESDEEVNAQLHHFSPGNDDGNPGMIRWSSPYIDTDGHSVIACGVSILKPDGDIGGILGVEISFFRLIQPLMKQKRLERFAATYFLLDENNRLIFSSEDGELECADKNLQTKRGGIRSFPYPELLTRFTASQDSQLIAKLDGSFMLVTWSRIRQPNWTLVQVVPQKDHNVIDRNLDTQNRRNILLDLRREKEDGQESE